MSRDLQETWTVFPLSIRDVSAIPKLFADFTAQGESEMWNIQISDKVMAPVIRQTIKRGHGNM